MFINQILELYPANMTKLLVGGAFLTSATYLSYKLYEHLQHENSFSNDNENYLILKRMNERFQSGHLQNTPFPTYLEMSGRHGTLTSKRSASLCESIQKQLERDWNCFMYQVSKLVLK